MAGRFRNGELGKVSTAHRKLHIRIKKWAKKMEYQWEVRRKKSGYSYHLNGKCIATAHPSSRVDTNLRQELIRAGIPRDIIGLVVMKGSRSGYELPDGNTPHDKSVSLNLRDAKAGELVWVRGHNTLVMKRLEQPDITKNCDWCGGCGSFKDFMERGFAHVFGEDWKETQEPIDYSSPEFEDIADDGTCPCVEIGVVVQFLPNGMKERYEHQFPPYDVEANRQKVESWTQR